MALTPFVRVAQFATRVVTSGLARGIEAATFIARAIITFPTPYIEAAQLFVRGVFQSGTRIQVPQFIVRAVTFTWPGNPKVRAWGFSQDGHDFYVLHLGALYTIVYDVTTGSWSRWKSAGRETWRAGYGMNWLGIAKDNYDGGAVTQVIAGDENLGVMWTLDPASGVDDHPVDAGEVLPYVRSVRGGVPITERNNVRANAIWLRISTGEPEADVNAEIRLRSSEDQGKTWIDHGTVTVNPYEYQQTIYWRSLGLIRPPVRIFEFIDTGAMVRIDGADIDL